MIDVIYQKKFLKVNQIWYPGKRTVGIENVVGSSIAREADSVFYTLAGPEIAVATTKAYSTQLVATYALAIQFAKVREEISEERYVELIKEIVPCFNSPAAYASE